MIVPTVALHQTPHTAALLDQLGRRMRLHSEAQLAAAGLRPRHVVALTVLRDHQDLTQQALALVLQVDRTNLVGLLNELEAEAMVERRRSVEDRRRHLVVLTAAGQKRLADVETALTAVEDDVLSALEPEQRRTLYALLRQANSSYVVTCTTGPEAGADVDGAPAVGPAAGGRLHTAATLDQPLISSKKARR